ncbi:MAG TPA: hypothetical protein VKA49_04240 [Flavitalea sp.]|nr:hypothetical protein [Flavitalea sp.]
MTEEQAIEYEDILRRKVLRFVESQSGYTGNLETDLRVDWMNNFHIAYGFDSDLSDNTDFVLRGLGMTIDEAYENFVINWNEVKGFEGLREQFEEVRDLEDKVLSFIQQQEGFAGHHERLHVRGSIDEWIINYGENAIHGIIGKGCTPDDAYVNFMDAWFQLKGFQWITNRRKIFIN